MLITEQRLKQIIIEELQGFFDEEDGTPLMNYSDETGQRLRLADMAKKKAVPPSPQGDHPLLQSAIAGEMADDEQREAGFLGPKNYRDQIFKLAQVKAPSAQGGKKEDPANAPTKIVPPKAAASRNQQLLNMMFAKAAGMPEGPGLEKLMNKIEKFMIMMNK